METFKAGETVGNGAAINIELGWIPDRVEVYNATDGDKVTVGFPNRWVIPFSSGGTNEVVAGSKLVGATSHATAIVKEVLLYSGTWAGGDAAGFFVVHADDLHGTFTGEAAYIYGNASGSVDDATVTANVTHSYSLDTEAAGETGNAAIAPYAGVAGTNSKGFTIGSTVAEEAKLLRWSAQRNLP